MRENLGLTHGALFSQRALTALVESGMTRDDAYRVVQENAQRAWDTRTEFRDLLAEAAPDLDLDAVFDYGAYLTHLPEIFERLEALASDLDHGQAVDAREGVEVAVLGEHRNPWRRRSRRSRGR